MSVTIEQINNLKLENKKLYDENIILKAEVDSLKKQLNKLETALNVMQSTFNQSLTTMQTSFNTLLEKQAVETKALIEASQLDKDHILQSLDNTLVALNVLQGKYDALKTEYNQYIKNHP